MFKDYDLPKGFLIKLGKFVSHEVVSYFDGQRHYRTINELNQYDRLKLANQFYSRLHESYKDTGWNEKKLLMDIAISIDDKIPKAYMKHFYKLHDHGPSNLIIDGESYGFVYQYEENKSI
ncbi:MAG: hypothetical protein K9L62_16880 [Vallitaleaceae bacterium]|nr:hypothetical protein [Vallitaleaceae bacterium]